MAVIDAWAEDIDCLNDSVTVRTTAGYFTSGYSRCAIEATSGWIPLSTFASVTDVWMRSTVYYYGGGSDPAYARRYLRIQGSEINTKGIAIGARATDRNKINLYTFDGTTYTEVAYASDSLFTTTLHSIAVHISDYTEDHSKDGNVKVYLDNQLVIDYTGNISQTGLSGFGCISFQDYYHNISISQIVVADEDVRGWSLVTCYPNGVGAVNSFSGTYTDIDETTLSDLDVIYSNTASTTFQCSISNLPAGAVSVVAAVLSARATVSTSSGATSLLAGIQSGSTISVTSVGSLSNAWAGYHRVMNVNPVTGNAFTMDEINNAILTFVAE